MENQNQSVNEIKYFAEKGNLKRNSPCPCGSGKKVKKCHPHFLQIRHYVVQREINISNGLAAHNKAANMGKQGYRRMTRTQFIDSLNEQENNKVLNNEQKDE